MKGIKVRLLAGVLSVSMLMPQAVWGADAELSEADLSLLTEEDQEITYLEEDQTGLPEKEVENDESQFPGDEQEKEETEGEDSEQEEQEDPQTPPVTDPEEGDEDDTEETKPEGWNEEDGKIRYYYSDGTFAEDVFLNINGKYFYFDQEGFLATGWQTVENEVYYLKKTGEPGSIGQMFTGLQTIGGKTFYFASDGALRTGWQTIGNYRYYFQKSGAEGTLGRMVTGWLLNEGRIYYLKQTGDKGVKGRMFTGWMTIGGKRFYFDQEGAMATGWCKISGSYYYFKASGTYGVKGARFTGLQTIGGKTFYFASNGVLQTGWQKIKGYYYYFQKSGAEGTLGRMVTGWLLNGGKIYYLKQSGEKGVKGRRFTGWVNISGKTFYFNSSGAMQTGWQKIGNNNFYFSATGSYGTKGQMLTGLQTIGGKIYYLKKTGAFGTKGKRLDNYTYTQNGVTYHFGSDGAAVNRKPFTVQFYYNSGSGEYTSLRESMTGGTLVLPSIKSASGYTFLGWSDKPGQHSYPKYRAGERITVTKGKKLYSVVVKNPVAGPKTASVSQAYDKVFFIGDSRTVGMKRQMLSLNSNITENVKFICQNGAKLSWFQEQKASIISQIKKTKGKKAVIWNLGVNDLHYQTTANYRQTIANSYISEMEQLAKALKSSGCDMYFMSVNPLNDSECAASGWGTRYSMWVLDFNYLVRTGLSSYQYIDTYNYLVNTGFQLRDGLHFTAAVYGKIYNKAIETIDADAKS
ncbi:MAG: SGNH/GDSL hydrolase family protein [Ruminococcus sp.]|jgi:glucan-binding YG repeat protein